MNQIETAAVERYLHNLSEGSSRKHVGLRAFDLLRRHIMREPLAITYECFAQLMTDVPILIEWKMVVFEGPTGGHHDALRAFLEQACPYSQEIEAGMMRLTEILLSNEWWTYEDLALAHKAQNERWFPCVSDESDMGLRLLRRLSIEEKVFAVTSENQSENLGHPWCELFLFAEKIEKKETSSSRDLVDRIDMILETYFPAVLDEYLARGNRLLETTRPWKENEHARCLKILERLETLRHFVMSRDKVENTSWQEHHRLISEMHQFLTTRRNPAPVPPLVATLPPDLPVLFTPHTVDTGEGSAPRAQPTIQMGSSGGFNPFIVSKDGIPVTGEAVKALITAEELHPIHAVNDNGKVRSEKISSPAVQPAPALKLVPPITPDPEPAPSPQVEPEPPPVVEEPKVMLSPSMVFEAIPKVDRTDTLKGVSVVQVETTTRTETHVVKSEAPTKRVSEPPPPVPLEKQSVLSVLLLIVGILVFVGAVFTAINEARHEPMASSDHQPSVTRVLLLPPVATDIGSPAEESSLDRRTREAQERLVRARAALQPQASSSPPAPPLPPALPALRAIRLRDVPGVQNLRQTYVLEYAAQAHRMQCDPPLTADENGAIDISHCLIR